MSVTPGADPYAWADEYDFLICDNYFEDQLDLARITHRAFHVIRDPRDILISVPLSPRHAS